MHGSDSQDVVETVFEDDDASGQEQQLSSELVRDLLFCSSHSSSLVLTDRKQAEVYNIPTITYHMSYNLLAALLTIDPRHINTCDIICSFYR